MKARYLTLQKTIFFSFLSMFVFSVYQNVFAGGVYTARNYYQPPSLSSNYTQTRYANPDALVGAPINARGALADIKTLIWLVPNALIKVVDSTCNYLFGGGAQSNNQQVISEPLVPCQKILSSQEARDICDKITQEICSAVANDRLEQASELADNYSLLLENNTIYDELAKSYICERSYVVRRDIKDYHHQLNQPVNQQINKNIEIIQRPKETIQVSKLALNENAQAFIQNETQLDIPDLELFKGTPQQVKIHKTCVASYNYMADLLVQAKTPEDFSFKYMNLHVCTELDRLNRQNALSTFCAKMQSVMLSKAKPELFVQAIVKSAQHHDKFAHIPVQELQERVEKSLELGWETARFHYGLFTISPSERADYYQNFATTLEDSFQSALGNEYVIATAKGVGIAAVIVLTTCGVTETIAMLGTIRMCLPAIATLAETTVASALVRAASITRASPDKVAVIGQWFRNILDKCGDFFFKNPDSFTINPNGTVTLVNNSAIAIVAEGQAASAAIAIPACIQDGITLAEFMPDSFKKMIDQLSKSDQMNYFKDNSKNTDGNVQAERYNYPIVKSMSEFFKLDFGEQIKKISQKTNHEASGNIKIHRMTKTYNKNLKKGDYFYLDKTHGDHIEVFKSNGQKLARSVINTDGTLNVPKTEIAIAQRRFLKI